MNDSPVDTKLAKDLKNDKRDFNEQEAYFELCQIIAYAQSTKDYNRFIEDLKQWKSRYDVNLFSDDLKYKIVKCKYAQDFKPHWYQKADTQSRELRERIKKSMEKNVRIQ